MEEILFSVGYNVLRVKPEEIKYGIIQKFQISRRKIKKKLFKFR